MHNGASARVAAGRDAALVARFRAGDDAAFDEIHARYRARLVSFAARVLGDRDAHAEDVVQEALARAWRALRRDQRPMDLRPWLFRIVRNCCLDEIARTRGRDGVPLELAERAAVADSGADPAHVSAGRERFRAIIDDLAQLPDAQRHALVGRELDGASIEQLSRELGCSTGAVKNLIHRARRSLLNIADAREAACEEIRALLDAARGRHIRPGSRVARHMACCRGCRSYGRQLRRLRSAYRVLTPGPVAVALAGGGAAKLIALAAKGTAVTAKPAAGVGIALAVAGGGMTVAQTVLGPGDIATVPIHSPAVPGGRLAAGQPIPDRTAVIERRAHAGRAVLTCPRGMRLAGVISSSPARVSHGLDPRTIPGFSRRAVVHVAGPPSGVRIRVLCRTPDVTGSLLAVPALPSSPRPMVRVCASRVHLREVPRGAITSTALRDQPALLLGDRGVWLRVMTDLGHRGWIPRRATTC